MIQVPCLMHMADQYCYARAGMHFQITSAQMHEHVMIESLPFNIVKSCLNWETTALSNLLSFETTKLGKCKNVNDRFNVWNHR